MKTLHAGAFLLVFAAQAASAQDALYSNGSPDPSQPALGAASLSASGVPAPPGAMWSECAAQGGFANAVGGFSSHLAAGDGAFRFADDFTVPQGAVWVVDVLSVYAYRVGGGDGTSPFEGLNVRIWDGPPWDAASVVIFGDDTTDRLIASEATDVYRIFASATGPLAAQPDTQRRIRRSDADLAGVRLRAGTYWVDWQYTSALEGDEAFSPPVTIVGVRQPAGANAVQLRPQAAGSAWYDAVDEGKPGHTAPDVGVEMPFVLRGMATCDIDFTTDGSIDDLDITAFFAAFENGDMAADVNNDDAIDDLDISEFFRRFEMGC